MRSINVPVLVCLLMVGALGVVHGVYTDRWGPSGQLEAAVAGLDRLPGAFGEWSGEEIPFEAEDMARAGIKGWYSRRFQHARTQDTVSTLIVCGRGGPISVHTPDVCYTGAGYRQVSEEEKTIDLGEGGKHTFKVARFAKPGGVSQEQLEIYWAWSPDGRAWDVPSNPRMSLARERALYKMYVVRDFVPGSRSETTDPCSEFLRRSLPEIRQTLPPVAQ